MQKETDVLRTKILQIIQQAQEPLETREIEELLKGYTRTTILYRLSFLRGDGLIKGKQVGSGKRTWVWWKSI